MWFAALLYVVGAAVWALVMGPTLARWPNWTSSQRAAQHAYLGSIVFWPLALVMLVWVAWRETR